jgi:hypothetical protein
MLIVGFGTVMSALTSLLVRDDVVSVRQIEDALQRQVLEGGEIDTALLELVELPENVLIAYRAASFRAQPVSRDELMGSTEATRSLLLPEVAEAFRVVPITHDATTLIVAADSPLSDKQVAELSARVGLRIEWRITSEMRISAALAQFYGVSAPPRLRELGARVDGYHPGELPVVAPLQVTPMAALSADLMEGFDESVDFEAALEAAFDRVSVQPVRRTSGPLSARLFDVAPPPAVKPRRRSSPKPKAGGEARPASTRLQPAAGDEKQRASAAARPKRGLLGRSGAGRVPKGPLTAATAAEVLEKADERDTVVEVFFRYARQYFDTTVLFAIREDRALGLEAYNVTNLADVREVSVPFLRGSALDDLVRSLLPRVIDLSRKEEDRVFAQSIARLDAQPSALIPVCIKRRVVSLVYGDRTGEVFQLEDLASLVGLLPHVSRAFERIIRTRKAIAVHTHRSARAPAGHELEHAATQRRVLPLPGAPANDAVRGPDARAAEGGVAVSGQPARAAADGGVLALAEARTKQAMNSLGVPRTAPPPPTPRARVRSPAPQRRAAGVAPQAAAPEAREESPLQPEAAPVDAARSSKLPTPFFSKPPPGTGRYSSQRDSVAGQPAAQEASPASGKPALPGEGEDTQPVRRGRSSGQTRAQRSSVPGARASSRANQPPSAAAKAGHGSRPAQADGAAKEAKSRTPARSSKPPPGAGMYRSHGFTTELISVPSDADAVRAVENWQPPLEAEAAVGTARDDDASVFEAVVGHAGPPSRLPPVSEARQAAILAEQREQIAVLVQELCGTRPEDDGLLIQQLLRFGDEALDQLCAQFPGPLWFDRRRPHARVPLGRDISPIARALVAFGDRAYARFTSLLRAPSGDVRYYATLFVSDRVLPALLEPLIERLFDEDPQIRLMVRDTLPHYRRVLGFSKVAERLRSQAADPNAPLKARLAALDAISVLRDASSVPILIELITHADKQISVPSYRALVAITCQDFAKSVKKWRAWYEANAGRHRVEWLIEALMHSDQTLRGAAGLELQKVTQVYYGYVAAAPKRDREQAQKRYWDWWRGEGHGKF